MSSGVGISKGEYMGGMSPGGGYVQGWVPNPTHYT